MGIVMPNAILGELTPKMAQAIASSEAILFRFWFLKNFAELDCMIVNTSIKERNGSGLLYEKNLDFSV